MARVEGKVAIVTGGAKGIGAADSRLLAREGAKVVITDVDEEEGLRLAKEIGTSAIFIHHDVRHESEWISLTDRVLTKFGRLDILVNNAGVAEPGTIETTTEETYRFVMGVSADGAFFGCKHAIPAMKKTGGGSIINMASLASLRGEFYVAAYCAAKGAVEALTRAVAIHCAQGGLNIRCNSVHPGGIDTPMVRSMPRKMKESELSRAMSGPSTPLGRADDVAYAVLYLASDESRFTNGQRIVVDGGSSVLAGALPHLALS